MRIVSIRVGQFIPEQVARIFPNGGSGNIKSICRMAINRWEDQNFCIFSPKFFEKMKEADAESTLGEIYKGLKVSLGVFPLRPLQPTPLKKI